MSFWRDIAPAGGWRTIRCYPNYTLPGGAMYIYGDGLTGCVKTYTDFMTYEPDGVTPITPNSYAGVLTDYPRYENIACLDGSLVVAEIIRVDHGSGRRTPVRGSAGAAIVRQKFIVVDPEAPLTEKFHYEVLLSNGATYTTDPCEAVYEVKSPRGPHCVPVLVSDPLIVTSMQWVDLMSIDPLSYPSRQELKDIISRYSPVALSGLRSTARTAFHFLTRTLAERQQLLNLFMPGRVLLYRNPNAGYPENNWYIAVGDVTENRVHPDHARPERKWDVEVAVVDRPDGILVPAPDRTYVDVREYEPDGHTLIDPDTYTGVRDDYGDYLTILFGGRGGGSTVAGENVDPSRLVYGGGRYPTRAAARTSWSLNP